MKKKVLAITAALMLMTAPAMAQIFIMEDEENIGNRCATNGSMAVPLPGINASGEDWYAPVGSGVCLLAGLAGAYLVGKRKKNE